MSGINVNSLFRSVHPFYFSLVNTAFLAFVADFS